MSLQDEEFASTQKYRFKLITLSYEGLTGRYEACCPSRKMISMELPLLQYGGLDTRPQGGYSKQSIACKSLQPIQIFDSHYIRSSDVKLRKGIDMCASFGNWWGVRFIID